MPRVKQVTEPSVGARALRIPGQRLNSAGAHGEAVGEALLDVSDTMRRRQDEDDLALTKERVNSYRETSRKRMYGDDDAYLNRAGSEAYRTGGDISKELDDARKELEKDLSPRQVRLFKEAVNGYVSRDNDNIARHSQRQRISWLNDQDAAVIQSAQEDGSLNWNDNRDDASVIRKTAKQLGQRAGWSDERIENEVESRLTAMHLSAIDNILESNPALANDYLAANLEDITPSLRDDIRAKIDNRIDTVWSMGVADTIRVGGGTLAQRLDDVNAIDDPERRKLVRSQVEHDYRMEKVADQEAQIQAYDSALKGVFIAGQNPHQWRANNFDEWELLSGQQQRSLMKPETAASQTDIGAYYEMKGLMASDPDKAREYLATNVHKFSATDSKKFIDQMFKPVAGQKPAMTDLAAFKQTAETVLGKRPTKGGTDRQQWDSRSNTLYGMYQEQLDQWYGNNAGAKFIPNSERQSILDQFEIRARRQESFFGVDFLNPDTEVELWDVPEADRRAIELVLTEEGAAITPRNILAKYMGGLD